MVQCFRGMFGIQHDKREALDAGATSPKTFEGAILSVPMAAIFHGLMVDVTCLALRHCGITALV